MFARRAWIELIAIAICLSVTTENPADEWKQANGPLMTQWAKEVTPDNALSEYPRPQMVRDDWTNLNGLWEYAITERNAGQPKSWSGQILVPFCVESALSGVMKQVGPDQALWYRRTFNLQPATGTRVLLHFGAVDWQAAVWVNGKHVGQHVGGYDPFSFDITGMLEHSGLQTLVVKVLDPTDASFQPRGKQVRKPGGIWYTAVTGIWQTVWLEPVSESYIQSLRITPNIDQKTVTVQVDAVNAADKTVRFDVLDDGRKIATGSATVDRPITSSEIPEMKLWSPDSPHLYSLAVYLENADQVSSYFGMRKIEMRKDDAGVNRLLLNNRPLFQFGQLDQGWWPDGLYTAPTDDALRYDIEVSKKLGFNMCRKHVKVESARWYYWCDRLGLLVWQDMPSGDKTIGGNDADFDRSAESEEHYRREWQAIIDHCRNHPCVVVWVPFNEGWGQFKTNEILDWTKKLDPTRLVDGPSGWADRQGGDLHDLHAYPGPGMFPIEDHRASVLGEFGGLGLPVANHTWQAEKNWGYRSYENAEDLSRAYIQLISQLPPLIGRGLAAAVYTQTTDVEIEVNGMMTYDRGIIKIDPDRIAVVTQRLYEPPPVIMPLVATSQIQPQAWRYTIESPNLAWTKPEFDDSNWMEGLGGFGTRQTPATVVRTEWSGSDIWIRRFFELKDGLKDIQLLVHHDEDAEIYINGVLAAKLNGYTTDYVTVPIEAKAIATLGVGKNLIAIHCRQTSGGQYINAGIVVVKERTDTDK